MAYLQGKIKKNLYSSYFGKPEIPNGETKNLNKQLHLKESILCLSQDPRLQSASSGISCSVLKHKLCTLPQLARKKPDSCLLIW